jgi:hypothetical protein
MFWKVSCIWVESGFRRRDFHSVFHVIQEIVQTWCCWLLDMIGLRIFRSGNQWEPCSAGIWSCSRMGILEWCGSVFPRDPALFQIDFFWIGSGC